MHLTNSIHENDAGPTGYKMDHDMLYYSVSQHRRTDDKVPTSNPFTFTLQLQQNPPTELNHGVEGFINTFDEYGDFMEMGSVEGE